MTGVQAEIRVALSGQIHEILFNNSEHLGSESNWHSMVWRVWREVMCWVKVVLQFCAGHGVRLRWTQHWNIIPCDGKVSIKGHPWAGIASFTKFRGIQAEWGISFTRGDCGTPGPDVWIHFGDGYLCGKTGMARCASKTLLLWMLAYSYLWMASFLWILGLCYFSWMKAEFVEFEARGKMEVWFEFETLESWGKENFKFGSFNSGNSTVKWAKLKSRWHSPTCSMTQYADYTLAFRNLHRKVHVASKLHFCQYMTICWTWPLTFGSQLLKNAQYCPSECFQLINIATWYTERCYGINTVILPIFGHLVNFAFDLWTSNFQKCSALP